MIEENISFKPIWKTEVTMPYYGEFVGE